MAPTFRHIRDIHIYIYIYIYIYICGVEAVGVLDVEDEVLLHRARTHQRRLLLQMMSIYICLYIYIYMYI